MSRKVRLLITDDEEHVRNLLRVVCTSISGVEVVGEAVDGEDLIAKFKQFLPDVVSLDINMPKITGTEALKKIKEIDSETVVVMLTSLNSIDVVRECIEHGAKSYILKSNPPDRIRDAIKQVCFDKMRKIAST